MGARDAYERINNVLNDLLFDGRDAGRSVYLVLDNEARTRAAEKLGIIEGQLEDAICACVGATLEKKGDPYSNALFELRRWRKAGTPVPPPFTAILFTLSYAAAIMDGDDYTGKNNYYTRLAQLTRLDRATLSLHGKSTEALWKGLNDWLLQHNYEVGRPTARSLNSWVYVGYALSQAIVRASDRALFHDLFERYGFSGSEVITPRDMEHYVSSWMDTAGPSQRLKRVWRNTELHERVAEAAIAELRNWGSRDVTSVIAAIGTRPMRLSLLANLIAGFPRPSLELHLARVGEVGQHGQFSLRGSASSFYLSGDVIGGVSTLSPNPFGEGFKGLSNSIQLEGQGGSNSPSLEWEPRLIIPFSINAAVNTWLEVPRVTFATPHLLMVRDANNLPAEVERYLASACTSRPRRAADNLTGLPDGWVLYQDVQVRQLVDPEKKELECLVPFDDDGVLSFEGGLQLLPGFYHAKMPPLATFVAGKGPTNIEAKALGGYDGTLILATSELAECELPLQGLSKARSASVCAWRADEKPTEKEVFFRDAGNPHPLHRGGRGRLSYTSMLSASQQARSALTCIEGLLANGNSVTLDAATFGTNGTVPEGELEDLQEAKLSVPLMAQAARQTCIERGYHVTRFPLVPPKTPPGKEFEGVCSDCKRREIIIYRRRRDVPAPKAQRIELPAVVVKDNAATKVIDADVLLDALSFLGHGSWTKFQSLVGAWGEGTRHPRQVAHELFLLGFLDLELQPGSNAIKSWCVPPPILAFTTSGKAFLSGFRSSKLVEDTRAAIESAGGVFELEPARGVPTRAWVKGTTPEEAMRALGGVGDAVGRRITVVSDAPARLAAKLPELEGIGAFLQPISIGRARNLQRFSLTSVRWKDVSEVCGAGAYRWNDGLQLYAYVDTSSRAYAAPYQVAKLLAAKDAFTQLHRHDAKEETFVSTLGCEPPGLLERVLVACSGELPTVGRGTSIYSGVKSAVAVQLLKILYQAGVEHEARKSHQRH